MRRIIDSTFLATPSDIASEIVRGDSHIRQRVPRRLWAVLLAALVGGLLGWRAGK